MLGLFSKRKVKDKEQISLENIRRLYPISSLLPQHQILICAQSKIITLKRGTTLTSVNSTDDYQYYLLSGKLKLAALDGRIKYMNAKATDAMNPIANLQPRRYQVTAKTKSRILVTSRSMIEDYFLQAKESSITEKADTTISPILSTTPLDTAVESIVAHFEHDVATGRFILPSIPEVATQVVDILDDPDINADKIARKVSLDPAIAVKLVSAANSPLFRGNREITSCADAIVRLGLRTTRDLIKVFAVRDLYQSNSEAIQKRLRSHWNISKQVAAIAYILARLHKNTNPNEALLAGSIHNIGVVPALLYAEQMPEVLDKYKLTIDEFVNKTKTHMGVYMLTHWQWPAHLIDAVANAENWAYQKNNQGIDMTDIVIVANAHLNILRKFLTCPPLPEIASFSKLAVRLNLTPEKSIRILVNARKEIRAVTSAIGFPN